MCRFRVLDDARGHRYNHGDLFRDLPEEEAIWAPSYLPRGDRSWCGPGRVGQSLLLEGRRLLRQSDYRPRYCAPAFLLMLHRLAIRYRRKALRRLLPRPAFLRGLRGLLRHLLLLRSAADLPADTLRP